MQCDSPKIRKTVLNFFSHQGKKSLTGATEAERLDCNYLDIGVIDSMGIILMVTEFEEKFDIRFTAEDMQSYEFQTPAGLIRLIEHRLSEKP
jgi:acyl carrier protein